MKIVEKKEMYNKMVCRFFILSIKPFFPISSHFQIHITAHTHPHIHRYIHQCNAKCNVFCIVLMQFLDEYERSLQSKRSKKKKTTALRSL